MTRAGWETLSQTLSSGTDIPSESRIPKTSGSRFSPTATGRSVVIFQNLRPVSRSRSEKPACRNLLSTL